MDWLSHQEPIGIDNYKNVFPLYLSTHAMHVYKNYRGKVLNILGFGAIWRKSSDPCFGHFTPASLVQNLSSGWPFHSNLLHNESARNRGLFQKLRVSQLAKNFILFAKPESILSCSQEEILEPILSQLNPA
jgi:hypothetical protein